MSDPRYPSTESLASRFKFETLISDTSSALLEAPPERLHQSVQRALERVRGFFRADRCALLSVSADHQVVNVRFESADGGGEPVSRDINLVDLFPWSHETLLIKREPVRIARMADLPPEADVERRGWELMSIRSALTLPIETGEGALHLIVLNTVHEEREWPDVFVPRLRVLGEMLVGALARQETFEGLREAEARLASGAELAGLGHYEINYVDGSASVDRRFCELCGVSDDGIEGLRVVELWLNGVHPGDRELVTGIREQLHDGRLERVSVAYRYLHPEGGERWLEHLAGVATRDADGRAVSTYGVIRDITVGRRSEIELRDLSRKLIRAHEEERALLARELHDDITQRLAVMAIEVGSAELASVERPAAEALQSVRAGLVQMSEDVHALAYQLHPSVLEELGLAEALRAECERRGRQSMTGLTVTLETVPVSGSRDETLCLFRVAQEALGNVVRHAHAHVATVMLRTVDGGLLLAVTDDGVGFDPAAPRKGRSLGLASMRERVGLVNGTLDIESTPGGGTSVVAWVPMEGATS
jgi:PAS domain S-box-containing protein